MVDQMPKRKHRDSDGSKERRIRSGLRRYYGDRIRPAIESAISDMFLYGIGKASILCRSCWRDIKQCEKALCGLGHAGKKRICGSPAESPPKRKAVRVVRTAPKPQGSIPTTECIECGMSIIRLTGDVCGDCLYNQEI